MNNLQDLLQFILRHDGVAVFGNLGRNPQVVYDMLAADSQLQVVIRSNYYIAVGSVDNRIRMITSGDIPPDPIDLYVVLEPDPYKLVEKPRQAARWVVFTSHFTYQSRPETVWTYVSYFHGINVSDMMRNTQHLLKLQENSIQTHNVQNVPVNSINKLIVPRQTDDTLSAPDTFVIINLIHFSNPHLMSLAFWDAFDYMLAHKDFVKGWLICFPLKNGRHAFEQFIQNCLDALFCKTFEHGNVTSMTQILTLIPYYKSGSIDQTFNVPISQFIGAEYIAPQDPIDTCKAATMYNLEHWVGNLYRIKK
ncbi:hypothetical protein JTE90_016310 [Oedothorax gibbosus]|uniref:Uncharacterized protein n=1 Tax=Oedothorax gibbosus TaxID=931172 RepID=A0AAV6TQU7_9ARAC|nr:hypothetical protein JTE90_016310 [Oedothorax gibbosus]